MAGVGTSSSKTTLNIMQNKLSAELRHLMAPQSELVVPSTLPTLSFLLRHLLSLRCGWIVGAKHFPGSATASQFYSGGVDHCFSNAFYEWQPPGSQNWEAVSRAVTTC